MYHLNQFLLKASLSLNESDASIFVESFTKTEQFSEGEPNDLLMDLNLSEEVSELFASRL